MIALAIIASLIAMATSFYSLRLLSRLRRLQFERQSANLTAQSGLQMQLARHLEERERLLNALDAAFFLISPDGTLSFANAAARELFGTRNLVGRPFHEILLDPRLLEPIQHCQTTGDPTQSRIVFPQQTSPRGDLENRGDNAWTIDVATLPSPQSDPPSLRVMIRDVTAEHQTEQIRRDFVANASHELRTPMTIISGYLENLLEDPNPDIIPTPRRFLTVMRKHADRISRIVEDMLVISRLESGEASSLNIEPFRFRSCINDVLERLEPVILAKNAEISILMPDESLILQGDRFYWTQVLFNLVENALKQNTHPGLKVEIGCEPVPNTTKSTANNAPRRIWVLDNGVGIPSADLPHIFRRFYRVEKHHSNQEIKGTGLGLSIVKRAIEAHGGHITVESVPGRETRFLIEVPAHPTSIQTQ